MPDDEPPPPVGARFHRPAARSPAPEDTRPIGVPAPDPAPFAVVRRGYDPGQVDARIRALEEQVRALREQVRQAQAGRAEAERTAERSTELAGAERAGFEGARAERAGAERTTRPPAPPSGPVDHGVEDKIARMARHEAARSRVTALADAARLLEDASTGAARARDDVRQAEAQRAAAEREAAQRLTQVEERERRLHGRD